MLISPLNAFPWVLNGLVESWVSLKRVQKFLEMDELDFSHYYLPGNVYRAVYGQALEGGGDNGCELVSIVDGCFTWRREDSSVTMEESSAKGNRKTGDSDTNTLEASASAEEWLLDGIKLTIKKV